jgi:hypothetical protein
MIDYSRHGGNPGGNNAPAPKVTLKGRIILPRIENGIDWGTERTVLARVQRNHVPLTDLVVIPGHMVYDQSARKKVYRTNEFMFVGYDDVGAPGAYVTLQKGGRVTEVMKTRAADIDQGMNATVAAHLKVTHTVVVEIP